MRSFLAVGYSCAPSHTSRLNVLPRIRHFPFRGCFSNATRQEADSAYCLVMGFSPQIQGK